VKSGFGREPEERGIHATSAFEEKRLKPGKARSVAERWSGINRAPLSQFAQGDFPLSQNFFALLWETS